MTIDEAIVTIATGVSARLYNRYRNFIIGDNNDIRQELWIWSEKKRKKIQEWLDPAQDENDYQRGLHALEKSMYRAGDRYCRTQKAMRSGYAVRDEVFYNRNVLEIILPEAWSKITDVGVHVEEGPKPPSNPSEGGNRIATLFDIQKALRKLHPEDRNVIEFRFRDGLEPHEIADILGCSKSTVYRKIRTALNRMVEILGGENCWR